MINNVGGINRQPLLQANPADLENLLKLNIFSLVFLTKYSIEFFKKNPSTH